MPEEITIFEKSLNNLFLIIFNYIYGIFSLIGAHLKNIYKINSNQLHRLFREIYNKYINSSNHKLSLRNFVSI